MNKLPEQAKNNKGPVISKSANKTPNSTAHKDYRGSGSVTAT